MSSSDRLLRLGLRLNAGFSGLSGLALLLMSGTIEAWMFATNPIALWGLGVQLSFFAALLAWIASRRGISLTIAIVIVLLDIAWVAGSVVLLYRPGMPVTNQGRIAIAAAGVFVLGFVLLQTEGILRARRGSTGADA